MKKQIAIVDYGLGNILSAEDYLSIFDKIIHIAPLYKDDPHKTALEYSTNRIFFVPIIFFVLDLIPTNDINHVSIIIVPIIIFTFITVIPHLRD